MRAFSTVERWRATAGTRLMQLIQSGVHIFIAEIRGADRGSLGRVWGTDRNGVNRRSIAPRRMVALVDRVRPGSSVLLEPDLSCSRLAQELHQEWHSSDGRRIQRSGSLTDLAGSTSAGWRPENKVDETSNPLPLPTSLSSFLTLVTVRCENIASGFQGSFPPVRCIG